MAILGRKQDVSEFVLNDTLEAMDYRGRNGIDSAIVEGGKVGLGHLWFRTTPEYNKGKLVQKGNAWIALDGRIDNREELIYKLADSGGPREATDAELFLQAYKKWGKQCLDRLVGVFGVVIWDGDSQRLFCARDKTGVRQLYYAITDGGIIVGSEQRALLKHPEISSQLNEGLLAEYLTGNTISPGETFYADIHKLEAATFLKVEKGSLVVDRYWYPGKQSDQLQSMSDKEIIKQFRSLFWRVVSCRLRGNDPAVMMSGGLDSTSIACIAAKIKQNRQIPSVSAVFDTLDQCDESEYIKTVVKRCNLYPCYVQGDDYWPLKDMSVYEHACSEGPCIDQNLMLTRALYKCANRRGSNVLLTGFGGNLIDGSRLYYTDLFRQHRFKVLLQDAYRDPMEMHRILLWYIVMPAMPSFMISFAMQILKPDENFKWPNWISDEFIIRIGLEGRLAKNREHILGNIEAEYLYGQYFNPFTDFALDAERRTALAVGIEPRYPFLDARWIDFIFSLPPRYRYRVGQSKFLFRKAMHAVLPEVVRTRATQTNFNPLSYKGLRNCERNFIEQVLTDSRLAQQGYVKASAVKNLMKKYFQYPNNNLNEFWRVLSSELWLKWVDENLES